MVLSVELTISPPQVLAGQTQLTGELIHCALSPIVLSCMLLFVAQQHYSYGVMRAHSDSTVFPGRANAHVFRLV